MKISNYQTATELAIFYGNLWLGKKKNIDLLMGTSRFDLVYIVVGYLRVIGHDQRWNCVLHIVLSV